MKELFSKTDFDWYKQEIDVQGRYHHDHHGEPEKYPCKVVSKWVDEDNRPYTYYHKFAYKEDKCCGACGHTTKEYLIPTERLEDIMYD